MGKKIHIQSIEHFLCNFTHLFGASRYEKLNESTLKSAIAEGPKSIPFTQLVEWLTKELQFLYSLDEHVNAISSPDDSSSFLLELSSFLKEIGMFPFVVKFGLSNEPSLNFCIFQGAIIHFLPRVMWIRDYNPNLTEFSYWITYWLSWNRLGWSMWTSPTLHFK